MWNEIKTPEDISSFMDSIYHFHDSCIKEMKYISGAYVDYTLGMLPINEQRNLRVIFQRQFSQNSVLELEFLGLKWIQLIPADEHHTCEILDAALFIKEGCIYWCDDGYITEENIEQYDGTVICASQLRWRAVENGLGSNEYYVTRT